MQTSESETRGRGTPSASAEDVATERAPEAQPGEAQPGETQPGEVPDGFTAGPPAILFVLVLLVPLLACILFGYLDR